MKETDSIFIARFLAILGVITVHVSMNINNHHSELNFLFYKTLGLGAYGVHFFFLQIVCVSAHRIKSFYKFLISQVAKLFCSIDLCDLFRVINNLIQL